MHLRKRLLVVGEVFLDPEQKRLANSAFQAILCEYARIFEQVIYVGPCVRDGFSFDIGNLHCIGTAIYAKSWRRRAAFALSPGKRDRFFSGLMAYEPDIIEIRIPSVFTLLASRSLSKMGKPLVVYVAGDWETAVAAGRSIPAIHHIGAMLDRLQWPLIRRSIVVTAGQALATKYAALNACHVYRGTTHRETVRRPIHDPPRRLLYLGRLEPLKRVQDAISALEILVRQGLDASLIIGGDGPLRKELQDQVKAAGLDNRVEFLGYVWDSDAVRDLFLRSDILLLPSLSEGSPKVLPEAMAHGVIPIAIDGVGGINGVITDGVNGRLARRCDPDHIAALVLDIACSAETAAALVEGGYRYAVEHSLPREVEKQWSFVADRLGPEARSGA